MEVEIQSYRNREAAYHLIHCGAEPVKRIAFLGQTAAIVVVIFDFGSSIRHELELEEKTK